MSTKNHSNSSKHPVLLFDGVCNLCNGYVQWLIKRDPKGVFRYAALQSEQGQVLLKQYNLPTDEISTVVMITDNKAYTHSDVGIEIMRMLGGWYYPFYVFKLVPKFIRNPIYNWIARNRYNWFGQQESCMIPTPELKERFL